MILSLSIISALFRSASPLAFTSLSTFRCPRVFSLPQSLPSRRYILSLTLRCQFSPLCLSPGCLLIISVSKRYHNTHHMFHATRLFSRGHAALLSVSLSSLPSFLRLLCWMHIAQPTSRDPSTSDGLLFFKLSRTPHAIQGWYAGFSQYIFFIYLNCKWNTAFICNRFLLETGGGVFQIIMKPWCKLLKKKCFVSLIFKSELF